MKFKGILIILVAVTLTLVGISSCNTAEEDPWTNYDGSAIVCRRQGCGEKPVYPDWNRRYCSLHIQDDHYCRYPDCTNKIPNSSESKYCSEHN